MIASVIVNQLSSRLGLAKGKDIFAHQATGNKYIVVSATTVNSYMEIPFQRDAPLNIIVFGYKVSEGEILSEKIFNEVLGMIGSSYTNVVEGVTQKYKIQSVLVSSCPVMVPSSDSTMFTMNFRVMYQYTTQ